MCVGGGGKNEHRRLFLRSFPVKESKEMKQQAAEVGM